MVHKVTPNIRWLIRKDTPEILEIEQLCFGEYGWTADDYKTSLALKNVIGMVAEVSYSVVGVFIYELDLNAINIINLAVHPRWQRRGIGSEIIRRLKMKLPQQNRNFLRCTTRETNLAMASMLARNGFRSRLLRDAFEDIGEDGIEFVFSLKTQAPLCLKNRISQYIQNDSE